MINTYERRRRSYTNVLMFVGLMAMAMVAWLDHQNKLPERRPTAATNSDKASLVAFSNAKRINTELRRQNDSWLLQLPVQLPARNSRVARLLELQELDFETGYDASTVNLEAAQLEQSARLLQIDKALYRLGGIEPVSGKRYVQLGQKVLLLEDRYLPLMDGGLNAFADLQLPLQHASSALLEGKPLAPPQLLAWQKTQAMGVRPASPAAASHLVLNFEDSETHSWFAWMDKGLWVLQPQNTGYEYLINAAQAATLGLLQQP